jgi:hypothetical protein
MDLGTKMNGISIIMALQVVATRLAHDISLRFLPNSLRFCFSILSDYLSPAEC